MNLIANALLGLTTGMFALATAAFVWGGINRAAPCHSAPDFMSGGIFALFALGYEFGLPAAVVCSLLGVGIGAVVGDGSDRNHD